MPTVEFKKSQVIVDWDDRYDSLLELAEAKGLDLNFGCRQGNCTACQQPVIQGSVEYPRGHNGEPEAGNELLCCSRPAEDIVIDA